MRSYSYFQNEGDRNFKMDGVLLEDEVWNRIRIAPDRLPTGTLQMIPGSQFLRLMHLEEKPEEVQVTNERISEPSLSTVDLKKYTIDYKSLNRRLSIIYEAKFPHRILKWTEETGRSNKNSGKLLTTTATRTHQIKSPYWSKNSVSDSSLRKNLGLGY